MLNPSALFPTIAIRHSRRHFDGQPLAPAIASQLAASCRDFRPFPEARAVFINERPDDLVTGIIGSYGKVQGAVAYIVLIGDTSSPSHKEKAGYVGEALILEATALGLGTCWLGGFFKRAAVSSRVQLTASERVLAVIPIGYAAASQSAQERSLSALAGSRRRKPLSSISTFVPSEEWQSVALEAARLAPSAANRQPWRFSLEQGAVVVSALGGTTGFARLDCGIAMLHFEVGAAHAGVRGHWEFLTHPRVGRFVVE